MNELDSKIENDVLIRKTVVDKCGYMMAIKGERVITKEEFLLCYNTWVKGDKE